MLINVIGRKTSFLFHIFVLKSVLIFIRGLISSCDKCMLDWNFIAGLIATVAFDIIYFGAIIGTITVIILDNRNPVRQWRWILVLMFLPVVDWCLLLLRPQPKAVACHWQEELQPSVEEADGRISCPGFLCASGKLRTPYLSVFATPTRLSFRWKPCGSLYAGTFHDSILVARIAKGDQAHPHGVLYLRG